MTAKRLREHGVEVHEVPLDEVGVNGSGGPTCLTRPILRGEPTAGRGSRWKSDPDRRSCSIALPIAFNLTFIELGRAFDYPGILRQPTPVILTRFAAGGSGLIVRWWLFMLTALALLPLVVLVGVVLGSAPGALIPIGIAVGAAAAIVQVVGLVRWPFVVPELARRYAAADEGPAGDATRATIEVAFATLHRLLGVAIGEHLGYLLTGAWTVLVGAAMLEARRHALMAWRHRDRHRPRARDRQPRVRRPQRGARLGLRRDASCPSPTSPGRCGSSSSGCCWCSVSRRAWDLELIGPERRRPRLSPGPPRRVVW